MDKALATARKKHLGDLLTAARREAGLTQADLARRVGITPGFIGKVERGDRRLDVIVFLQLAQILDVDPASVVAALRRASKTVDNFSSSSKLRG